MFDKTGTLSVGRPEVTRVILFVSDSLCSSKLFTAIVGVAESHSEHPLGGAIVNFARRELGAGLRGECLDFQASPGRGLQCRVTGVGWGEGGDREGGERVKRYSCVETEASLSGRQISGVGEVNVSHESQYTVAVPTQYIMYSADLSLRAVHVFPSKTFCMADTELDAFDLPVKNTPSTHKACYTKPLAPIAVE